MEEIEENILDKLLMPPVSQIRFPLKLWKLLNTCDSGAISWSIDGKSFIINRKIFQTEFLSRKSDTFKTQNISSLVRQLNLYGFQKVQRRPFAGISRKNWPDLLEYRHTHFRRGYPELVNVVQRRSKEEEEDRIASNNLAMYRTPDPISKTQPLQNQDGVYSIARKEGNSEILEPFCHQGQGHAHGQSSFQPMKLPLKRLNKAPVRSKNTLQTISLSNQAGVFQFPITIPENSLQPITLPFKSHNLSSMSADKQDANFQTIPMVCGSLYGQESILKPITSPFGIQLLRNSVQISQSGLPQGQATQILQMDHSQELAYQTLRTEHFQGPGVQTLPTDHIYEQDDQTLQTDENSQGQGTQIIQMDHLQEPGVQILQMEEMQEKEVHTLTIEQIPEQGVQALEMEHTQGQRNTFTLGAVESPVVSTESETAFTSNQPETTYAVPSQFRTVDANDILATFYIPKHADPSSS